jgi:hypothetical protein
MTDLKADGARSIMVTINPHPNSLLLEVLGGCGMLFTFYFSSKHLTFIFLPTVSWQEGLWAG